MKITNKDLYDDGDTQSLYNKQIMKIRTKMIIISCIATQRITYTHHSYMDSVITITLYRYLKNGNTHREIIFMVSTKKTKIMSTMKAIFFFKTYVSIFETKCQSIIVFFPFGNDPIVCQSVSQIIIITNLLIISPLFFGSCSGC